MTSIRDVIAKNKKVGITVVGVIALVLLALAFWPNGKNTAQIEGVLSAPISFQQAVGSVAPDFSLEGLNGSMVRLSDYKGKDIVLFFNEGGMCYPACWNQMASLATDPRFNNNNTVVFSIVLDPRSYWLGAVYKVSGLEKAKILFDTNGSVSTTYDVLNLPSSMHPGRYPGHTYFVIDKNGVIRYTLDDPNMGINNGKIAGMLGA